MSELAMELDTRMVALAVYLELASTCDLRAMPKTEAEDIEQALSVSRFDECMLERGPHREYLVVTEEEANVLWDEQLDNYIEECILPEIPEQYRGYFDNEAWKRDARMDGRGHTLNHYDGHEYEETVTDMSGESETYYIYRQN